MYQMQTSIRTPIGLLPKLQETIGDFTSAYVAENFGDLVPVWDVLVAEGRIRGVIDQEGLMSLEIKLREVDCFLDDIKGLAESLSPFAMGPTTIQVFAERDNIPAAVMPVPNGFPFAVQ